MMELNGTGKQNENYGLGNEQWKLRLYIAGRTPKSREALLNLDRICATHLPKNYKIEVVDLLKDPKLAAADQILAIPTLVRRSPPPPKKIIGNLADEQLVLDGLDIRSEKFPS